MFIKNRYTIFFRIARINFINCFFLILILFIQVAITKCLAQKRLSLEDVLEISNKKSFNILGIKNSFMESQWSFINHSSVFRPKLNLSGTVPSYSRSISKITLPNGEDTFVSQNQSYSSLLLGVYQNVSLTGGTIYVGTSLDRIDVFGNNRSVLYSTVPFSISYSQNSVGFNNFKWQKKIEPLRYEVASKEFAANIEDNSMQTTQLYFDLLLAKEKLKLAKMNVLQLDTLYSMAQERYKIGAIGQSDLLQLEINRLNGETQYLEDSLSVVISHRLLFSFIGISEYLDYDINGGVSMQFFNIPFEEALKFAKLNKVNINSLKLRKLEAQKNVALAKSENSIRFDLRSDFGLSNSSNNFYNLYGNMERQNSLQISFSVPILDWGVAKSQKMRAESALSVVESQILKGNLELENEVLMFVSRWNFIENQIINAKKATVIASTNYTLEVDRYLKGAVTINDINAARLQRESATLAYLQILKQYWELYYTIREITLYDFLNHRMLYVTEGLPEL